jgi:hypothetical protein
MLFPSSEEEDTMDSRHISDVRTPWNKGKLLGQKAPFEVDDALEIAAQTEV